MTQPTKKLDTEAAIRVLRYWHEAVPNDRMAHLVKDATRRDAFCARSRRDWRGTTFNWGTGLSCASCGSATA